MPDLDKFKEENIFRKSKILSLSISGHYTKTVKEEILWDFLNPTSF